MKKPNILIVLGDSIQIGHLGCYGDPLSVTPHLDRMCSEGLRFEHAFATTPLCHCARSAWLTGLYPHANGMIANDARLQQGIPSFFSLLRNAGYRCGSAAQGVPFVADWMDDIRPGYQTFKQRRQAEGKEGDPIHEGNTPVEGRVLDSLDEVRDYQYVKDGLDLLTLYASRKNEPWAVSIEFDGPHMPCLPLREWFDQIPAETINLPESRHDTLLDRAPRHARIRQLSGQHAWPDARWLNAIRLYRANVAMLDHFLGRILAHLEELGCADDTLVIFSSDHGDLVGSRGILTKYGPSMDDSILRVPLVFRWPAGIRSHHTVESFVCGADLLPTLCSLSGATPPAKLHGKSLTPFFDSPRSPSGWRNGVVGTYYGNNGRLYTLRSYRDHSYKYVFDPFGKDEFYDIRRDPEERRNLICERKYRPIVREYAVLLLEELKKIDDPIGQSMSSSPITPGIWIEDGSPPPPG